MSFYRKYRPQKLAEIVGQDHVKQTFRNALKNKGLTHAYLFAGTRGTGKTSLARIIARSLNCLNPDEDGEPCNECEICVDALNGRLVDLIEIDAASNRGIDEIRELKEKIQFTPSRARVKVYVIDEAHMLTKEAFNALLKTLEEPPGHAYFILATTEPHKVPETVLSRTQRFDFHRIENAKITKHLAEIAEKEGIKAEPEALELIAKQSAGGMRDAVGMLEQFGQTGEINTAAVAQNLGLTRPQAVEDFVFALLFQKLPEALETINGLVAEGVNLIQFNKNLLMRLREIMLEKVAENCLAEAKEVLTIVEVFTRTGEELKNAIIPQLPLEMAVIQVTSLASDVTGSRFPAFAKASAGKQGTLRQAQGKQVSSASAPQGETTADKGASKKSETSEKKSPAKSKTQPAKEVKAPKGLSLEAAKAALPEVITKVKKSAIKLALKECIVLRTEDDKVVLGVGSDFLMGKLESKEARAGLAEIFSELLGTSVQVDVERAEIGLKSSAPDPAASSPALAKKSLVETAEELFEEGW
ncbi:MAG: DNA polymerase III subunit gamma/tau [Patescibacteria group bacterium]